MVFLRLFALLVGLLCLLCPATGFAATAAEISFPPSLEAYGDSNQTGLWQILVGRARQEPLNLVASLIFLLAIIHTFLASKFLKLAHHWRDEHQRKLDATVFAPEQVKSVSFKAEIMHFFGEVEAVFGIWVIPLLLVLTFHKGWAATEAYISHGVHFTEPTFVVVIMSLAATRPILRFAEVALRRLAKFGRETPAAWWLVLLTVGPLLGSLITEPAAMTICALLLSRQIYERKPSSQLAYATMGLLFVNISVGGTLTHFAAPPVLMVAQKWNWNSGFMFIHFGWKAALGILFSTSLYYLIFRRELAQLPTVPAQNFDDPGTWEDRTDPVPIWITIVHLLFLAWTVFTAHSPALFIGGFLFFLAFAGATQQHQNRLQLQPALLVGFFLAALVIHGGLQGWWIEPVLASLGPLPLLLGAAGLTAFNDNAAITYLASLVPTFGEALKYLVVAGAVAGGGLTVIANAPNPAGQSILAKHFEDGISPLKLFLGALVPTGILLIIFGLFR